MEISPTIELLLENKSDIFFADVKNYLNNQLLNINSSSFKVNKFSMP